MKLASFLLRFALSSTAKKREGVLNMNQLTQALEREGSRPLAFLRRRLASLTKPSVAVWAPIPLRLIVGYGFMEHGFAKLSRGPEAFAAILHTMGVPAPHLMAWLTILTPGLCTEDPSLPRVEQ